MSSDAPPEPPDPYAHLLTSRKRMQNFVAERVSALFPNRMLVKVRRNYLGFKPGRTCVALFFLFFDGEVARPEWVTASFGKPAELDEAYNALNQCGMDPIPPALLLEDSQCLLEVFPRDSRLPVLLRALSQSHARDIVAGAVGVAPFELTSLEADVIRYRPGRRCVLRYRFTSPRETGQEVIAKAYHDGERRDEVWRKLAALSPQARSAAMRVPKPFGGPGRASLLFMERMPGVNLGDKLEEKAAPEIAHAIRRAAAGLAAFHEMRLQGERPWSVDQAIADLRLRVRIAHSVAPELVRRIEPLLDESAARIRRACEPEECLIHGEYKPSQVLISDDSFAVVDLDRAGPGDPAIDLGQFMAAVRKEAVLEGQHHLCGADEYFLGEYVERTGRHGIPERARIYQAVALLRMVIRLFETAPHAWIPREEWEPFALLEEAAACLSAT
jgi:aminoglycoside phosphotransferase (APT) family kinase protein